ELAFCRIEGTTDNGIFIEGCSPLIRNCRITNNDNNGIYVSSSGELLLSNSIVSGNGNNGIATDGGNAELTNCIISYNTQQGIVQQGSADSLTLTNAVVAYNSGPGIITLGGTVSVTNSIIYYNTQQIVNSDGSVTVVYSDIEGGFTGRGNINLNPSFEDNITFALSENSPCIDEGDSSIVFNDIYFPPSLETELNDMGAYGGPLAGKWYDPLFVIPLSIDFGDVTVGDTLVKQVTVKNYGDTLLNITSISIRGISGGDFLVDTTDFVLEPMGSRVLNVYFTPSEKDVRNDSLDIVSDGGEKSVSLTGKGVVPDIWLPTTSLNFDEIPLGDSLSNNLTIHNFGIGTLYISDISSGNPVFSFNKKTAFSIPPGGKDSVTVVFKPDSAVSYNDTLLITSNDPDSYENPAEVTLTGAGLAPDISVNPDPLNFGDVIVNDGSTMLSISVSNKGNLELIVSEAHITGTDSAKFSIVNWQVPDTLQPDSSKDIQIKFAPDSWGDMTADLQIKSNSYYNDTLQISLTGAGLAPAISVNPNSLNFDGVHVGDDSVRSIYISNIGNMDLHVDTTVIIGINSSDFEIISGGAPLTIPTGSDSQLIAIKFLPASTGDKSASLIIISNDPDPDRDMLDIALTGKGVTPHISVRDTLNFNAVTVDSQRTLYLSVKNEGDGNLVVHTATITGEDFSDFEILSGGAPFTIPAGSDSQLIAIKFLPASTGEKSASLKIISNDPDPDRDTLNIALTGQGVIPDISVRDSLNFNAVTVDSQRTLYLPVKNEGGGDLYVHTTEIIGIDSSDFEIINGGAPFTIPAGSDSHSIELSFSPTAEGEKTAELRIVSNDPDVDEDTLQIHLKGEGVKSVIYFDTSLISLILGSNYTFQVYITSEKTEIKSAWLYFREGGKQGFTKLKLNKEEVNDSIWSADINPNHINERGIEYYLEVTYDKTTIIFPDNGLINPAIAVVNIPSLAFPNSTLANAYQKISLPLNSGSQNLKDLLEDDLGKYDNTQYRLFDWDQANEQFIELSSLDIDLPPGKAVWLITKDSTDLDIENCKSVNTGSDYSISLYEGWNMISVPFAFPVDWSAAMSQTVQGGALYYYDGSGWDNTASIMHPFMGYAIYSSRDTILKIPPEEAQTLGKKALSSVCQDDEWRIQIKAGKGEFKDDYNFAGVRQDACDLRDRFDVFEPPPIGRFVSLYFEQPEWNNYTGGYAADYREADKEGYWFEFTVKSNFSGRTALTFEAQNLPENFDWQVVSPETQVKYPKGKITTSKTSRGYRLAVGTEDFLSGELSEYKEMPDEFKLSQNYPNPFNPVTNIEYQLPRGGYISLEIYDILGRKVKTLHKNMFKEAGYYKVQWDGSNNMNKKAASGIYFLYLQGDSYAKAVKMLLQR
ncbi:MAG: choice-of-anchor D domain-containing protein, partial [Calditrichales bacterium]|nr:choice-of-anchor D domain-containing protein [Calditrichales bacterium]